MPRRGRAAAAALLFAACLASACGRPANNRVIMLGIDGLDPLVVDLLVSEGKLPNLARMRREGAYAPLRSSEPMLSPILWTTIATGRPPLEHGIGHFVAVNSKTGERLPVTSQMRKTRALWNVAASAGREVAVVGWWATWPAEAVRGTIVSDHVGYHFLIDPGQAARTMSEGLLHPAGIEPELRPLIRRPESVGHAEARRFVDVSAHEFDREFDFLDDVSHFRWVLATADSYRQIGLHLWRTRRPELLMVYIEGVDSTSHLFGHLFRQERLAGALDEQQRRFGRAIEEMYAYADEIVGEYLEVLDDRTTLIVLSDHGFELGTPHDDPRRASDLRRVSARYHRIDGVLYLYGAGIRRVELIEPGLLDVTPTVLALLGLPPAEDMPGRVLYEGLSSVGSIERVATYEPDAQSDATAARSDPEIDPHVLDRLGALGYLDATSPEGDRWKAAMHFKAGDYETALALYARLLEESPGDADLHSSRAGALAASGRSDEALAALERAIELDPVNAVAYHNRGLLAERRGDRVAAARDYRNALSLRPELAEARDGLRRLGEPGADARVPTGEERRAIQLAESAREATLRGDYPLAMSLLDEARSIAPDLPLVYQYRSNVAFLMGDREEAITALRVATDLEPENPLYRVNLERLEPASD